MVGVIIASSVVLVTLAGLAWGAGAPNVKSTYSLPLPLGNPVAIGFDPVPCAGNYYTYTAEAGTATSSGYVGFSTSATLGPAKHTTGYGLVAVAFDPITGGAYFAEPGIDTILETPNSCGTLQTPTVSPCPANALAWDMASSQMWATCPSSGFAFWIDSANSMHDLAIPSGSNALAYDPTSQAMLIVSTATNTVTAVESAGTPPINNPAWVAQTGASPVAIAVDTGTGDAYIANEAGNSVTVVSPTGSVVGTVSVGARPVALAYDTANGHMLVANSAGNSVTDIDGTTVVGTVSVGAVPIALQYDPATTNVYVANQGSSSVTVITPADIVATTIGGLTTPTALTYNPINVTVWAADSGASTAVEFTPTIATPTLAAGAGPWALLPSAGNVYATENGAGAVEAISATNGQPFPTLALTPCTNPTQLAYSAASGDIYATCPNGNVAWFPTALTAATTIGGTAGAGAIAYDAATASQEIMVGSLTGGTVYPISSGNVLGAPIAIPAATAPHGMVYDPGSSDMFVTSGAAGKVALISTTNTVVATPGVGGAGANPVAVALDTSTNNVWVACQGANTIVVLSSAGAVLKTITALPAGASPDFITYDPSAGTMVVSDSGTSGVSVISTSTYSVTNVATGTGSIPGPSVYNPIDTNVYVVDAATGNVAEVTAGSTPALLVTIPGPGAAVTQADIQYSSANENVYFLDNSANAIWAI